MLLRKWKLAIIDRNLQTEAHCGLSASLPEELTQEWEAMVLKWDAAPYPKAKNAPNPYEIKGNCKTLFGWSLSW